MTRRTPIAVRATLPCQLVISVTSVNGGVGRSSLAGLLAIGLADRVTGTITLMDTEPAGSSPWPAWAHTTTAASSGPGPLTLTPWAVGESRHVQIFSDASGAMTPLAHQQLLQSLAAGHLPQQLASSAVCVIDGPAGQGAAARWARTGQGGGYLPTQLTRSAMRRNRLSIGVLAVRGDHSGVGAALAAVTDLEVIGAETRALVVAVTEPSGGLPRPARARMELLRDRVAAIISIPHQQAVARNGPTAYANAKVLAAAGQTVNAVLAAAAALYRPPLTDLPAPVAPVAAAFADAGHPAGPDPFAVLSNPR